MDATGQVVRVRAAPRFFPRAWFDAFAQRFPFLGLVVAIFASNAAGSFFSFFYNTHLIVKHMNAAQAAAFWDVAAPLYNLLAYPIGFGILFYLLWPMFRCLRALRRDEPIDPTWLQFCRKRLINLPLVQLTVNSACVGLGAFFFPLVITLVAGADDDGPKIWIQFFVSFVISAIFTTVQTFFILQAYLIAYLYPEFFKDARPIKVPGIIGIPFTLRLVMLFFAVALMPLAALLAVAFNFPDRDFLLWFAPALVIVSAITGGGIFWLMGRDLWRWIHLHTDATGEIAKGNYDIRIDQPRPDEWGVLTNHFNDMAVALNQAWESHETLGQLVSPEVRDRILSRMRGFEVNLQEITVLFVDIRGFTTRCAGADPQHIGALLNRFLTLALQSIEEKGGYVNKFLGDGVMALFGATQQQDDHADLALASAREMLERLCELNKELIAQGVDPLVVGIGIHSGPALVGCFGATVQGENGQPLMRREFTAIGETVNLCQRIEQLTKRCGGPILISDGCRQRLRGVWPLQSAGPQEVPGVAEALVVYRVGSL